MSGRIKQGQGLNKKVGFSKKGEEGNQTCCPKTAIKTKTKIQLRKDASQNLQ